MELESKQRFAKWLIQLDFQIAQSTDFSLPADDFYSTLLSFMELKDHCMASLLVNAGLPASVEEITTLAHAAGIDDEQLAPTLRILGAINCGKTDAST